MLHACTVGWELLTVMYPQTSVFFLVFLVTPFGAITQKKSVQIVQGLSYAFWDFFYFFGRGRHPGQ